MCKKRPWDPYFLSNKDTYLSVFVATIFRGFAIMTYLAVEHATTPLSTTLTEQLTINYINLTRYSFSNKPSKRRMILGWSNIFINLTIIKTDYTSVWFAAEVTEVRTEL